METFDYDDIQLIPNKCVIKSRKEADTSIQFGPLPALFRGDYYNFLLIIVLDLDYALVALFFGLNWLLEFPIPSVVFAFFYNMMYFRHLFNKGYRPADERSRQILTNARYWKEK